MMMNMIIPQSTSYWRKPGFLLIILLALFIMSLVNRAIVRPILLPLIYKLIP